MTKVKICGITSLADAAMASRAGADILGFNFYPGSPRYISPAMAGEIVVELAAIKTAGVFVNEELERVLEIAKEAHIDMIQLHGDEDPAFVKAVRSLSDLEVIKVFRLAPAFSAAEIADFETDAILLDAFSKDLYGGSGKRADRTLSCDIAAAHSRVFLAGGLTPANVREAIDIVKPYGVDAASGVESEPGRKDISKVESFIRNVKNA